MRYQPRSRLRRSATLLAALTITGGCAVKNKPATATLPPRGRMAYDADATIDLAVANRLSDERRSLAALLAGRDGPTTRPAMPATVEVPAPQLLPVPAELKQKGFAGQGPTAHPVAEALRAVAGANDAATRSPTPDGFLNAVHYYDYAPGVRYNVVAAADFLTVIALRPGERLRKVSSSDTSNYAVETSEAGDGETAQTLLLVKPKRAGSQSNWVITTDERVYLVDVFVNAEPTYQSQVAWTYPLDGLRVIDTQLDRQRLRSEKGGDAGGTDPLAAFGGGASPSINPADALAFAGVTPDAGPVAGPLGGDLDRLNFGYVVLYQQRGRDGRTRRADPPAWVPLRAFDDGAKTFVQFPPAARNLELPPLFALDHPDSDRPRLVNYRRRGDYLVADGLFPAAEMRAGEAPQQVVKIVRGEPTDPSVQPSPDDASADADAVPDGRPEARRRAGPSHPHAAS